MLAEPDYRYGVGPIIARVVAVLEQVSYDAERWWHVEAEVANGTPDRHGGWVQRTVYLRESSLPSTRRRPITRMSPQRGAHPDTAFHGV